MIITIKYPCKYILSFAQNYVFSSDKCFNSKTNREIKQVYNNGSIGYNVNGKFHKIGSNETPLALGKGRNCHRFLLLLVISIMYFLISEKFCIFVL